MSVDQSAADIDDSDDQSASAIDGSSDQLSFSKNPFFLTVIWLHLTRIWFDLTPFFALDPNDIIILV